MKASEIFLDFAAPLYAGVPQDVDEKELKRVLTPLIVVWNAVVLDKNPNRRRGELPQRLKNEMKTIGVRHRRIMGDMFRFWVRRKDTFFKKCDWPLDIEVYRNVKGEVIIRAKTFALDGAASPNYPSEWLNEKELAPITPI